MSMEERHYPIFEEEERVGSVREPALATPDVMNIVVPDDLDYARIVNGVLQVTPDIEEEIAAVERGEVVSMSEFKSMFARWLEPFYSL